jgi:hypothetical protein
MQITKRPVGRPKGIPKTGGKQKGFKMPATLAKEAAREAARQRITARINEIIDAQVDNAIGIAHFMLRDKATGQWERLTNPDQIVKALNDPKAKEGSTFLVYTKDPNTNAARDMLAYAIDKPKEQPMEMKVDAGDELIAALHAGRARAAKGEQS